MRNKWSNWGVLVLVLLAAGCADDGATKGPNGQVPANNVAPSNNPLPGQNNPISGQNNDIPVAPYQNDREQAASVIDGMTFSCTSGGEFAGRMGFMAGGELGVELPDDATIYPGTYRVGGDTISIEVPSLGLAGATLNIEVELDVPVALLFDGLDCHATALRMEGQAGTDGYRCPSIKWIPEISYEDNEFYFDGYGTVQRRRWRELTGANDTLYSNGYGVYKREGDYVYMVFHPFWERERFLNGLLGSDGLYIRELEPESGPCTPL